MYVEAKQVILGNQLKFTTVCKFTIMHFKLLCNIFEIPLKLQMFRNKYYVMDIFEFWVIKFYITFEVFF